MVYRGIWCVLQGGFDGFDGFDGLIDKKVKYVINIIEKIEENNFVKKQIFTITYYISETRWRSSFCFCLVCGCKVTQGFISRFYVEGGKLGLIRKEKGRGNKQFQSSEDAMQMIRGFLEGADRKTILVNSNKIIVFHNHTFGRAK